MVVTSVLRTRTPVDPARLRSVVFDRLLARYPVYLRKAVRHAADCALLLAILGLDPVDGLTSGDPRPRRRHH